MKLLAMAVLASVLMAVAVADGGDHAEARRLVESGTIVPAERVLEHARQQHPGRLLELELKTEDERYLYEVEILDGAGIVWELYYDAQTAELVRQERERAD